MTRIIGLEPATTDLDVRLLHDGKTLKYKPKVLTRTVKREVTGKLRAIDEAAAKIDGDIPTEDQEEEVMRAVCDVISAVLEAKDDASPAPGDLLYDSWLADEATDDQITGLLKSLTEDAAENPT